MRLRALLFACLSAILLFTATFGMSHAEGSHTVKPGESLTGIAAQYGVTVAQLATANGLSWNAWVYVGQVLTIPGSGGGATTTPPASAGTATTVYVVQPGDTLFSVALRYGTTVEAIKTANGLSGDMIYSGQRLYVPGTVGTNNIPSPVVPGGATIPAASAGERWIDVNLSTQTITAYEGNTPVYTSLVSTGLARTPTVVGSYRIYVKYVATDMTGGSYATGDYYYLSDVPYTMYFFRGYGIHGTYWHNNFGQPMSRGCVNLPTPVAEWFFNWASVGTRVETHY
jgi:LysM repeat protein